MSSNLQEKEVIQHRPGARRFLHKRTQNNKHKPSNQSSEKSKPIARWGHKTNGSFIEIDKDGRAAGEIRG